MDRRTHRFRFMIRRDLPAVLAIESKTRNPWQEEHFLQRLRERNCVGMVAEIGERIDGFFIYRLHPGVIQIENLAVAEHARRQGIGTRMLAKLTVKLLSHRRDRLEAIVRETNFPAIKLFSTCGYMATGIERGLYADTGEDGYRMVQTARMAGRVLELAMHSEAA